MTNDTNGIKYICKLNSGKENIFIISVAKIKLFNKIVYTFKFQKHQGV